MVYSKIHTSMQNQGKRNDFYCNLIQVRLSEGVQLLAQKHALFI